MGTGSICVMEWEDKLLFAGSAGGQFVPRWSVLVTPLGTARYRFASEMGLFRYRVTPNGVIFTAHVRNAFAAGHARKQQFTASLGERYRVTIKQKYHFKGCEKMSVMIR